MRAAGGRIATVHGAYVAIVAIGDVHRWTVDVIAAAADGDTRIVRRRIGHCDRNASAILAGVRRANVAVTAPASVDVLTDPVGARVTRTGIAVAAVDRGGDTTAGRGIAMIHHARIAARRTAGGHAAGSGRGARGS